TATAAEPTWNSGSTIPSITSSPLPGELNVRASSRLTLSSVMGALAFPRIPTPFHAPETFTPVSFLRTKYNVLSSGCAAGPASVETTYPSACPADVTNDFCALTCTWPLLATARLTGAQKWLRDP